MADGATDLDYSTATIDASNNAYAHSTWENVNATTNVLVTPPVGATASTRLFIAVPSGQMRLLATSPNVQITMTLAGGTGMLADNIFWVSQTDSIGAIFAATGIGTSISTVGTIGTFIVQNVVVAASTGPINLSANWALGSTTYSSSAFGVTYNPLRTCLAHGTLLRVGPTLADVRAIETLRVGDEVTMLDFVSDETMQVRVARVSHFAIAPHDPLLVTIRAGALAPGVPSTDVSSTTNHPFLLGTEHVETGEIARRYPNGCAVGAQEEHVQMYSVTLEREGGLILASGMVAHALPPWSCATPLPRASYQDESLHRDTARTSLLYNDDGRQWVQANGSRWVHPGTGAGGIWVHAQED